MAGNSPLPWSEGERAWLSLTTHPARKLRWSLEIIGLGVRVEPQTICPEHLVSVGLGLFEK